MNEVALRRAVLELLDGGGAHVSLAAALEGLPAEDRFVRALGVGRSVWELLEHLRIAQEDILRYTLDPGWRSPPWPEGYWAEPPEMALEVHWDETVTGFRRDLEALRTMVLDPGRDLTAAIPHGEGRTYLRQALLVADHNAYHLGQIVAVRRSLGSWP